MRKTALLAVSAAFVLSQAAAQTESSSYPQTRSQDTAGQSPSENKEMKASRLAAKVLNKTHEARQAIESKDKSAASRHIEEALQAARQIDSQSEWVPIYTEFEQVSVIAPSRGGQTGQQSARSDTNRTGGQQPRTGKANEEMAQSDAAAPAVQSAAGGFTTVALNLEMAREHLDAAHTALEDENWTAADGALAAVQKGGVMTATVAADMPLLRARQNLGLARIQAQEQDWNEAQTAMNAASDALSEYAAAQNAAHAGKAQELKQEIQSFQLPQNKDGAVKKIDQWWSQVNGWFSQQPQTFDAAQSGEEKEGEKNK